MAVRRGKGTHQLTPIDQLRDLLIRLSETWSGFCTFYADPAIPWTNNGTEQVIGRMKMRARTVRGYKTWPGMQTGLMLAGMKSIRRKSSLRKHFFLPISQTHQP
ncbi:MAG: hypothetical protein IMZ50_11580 [Candidatus Atribacteria bacterium]|nr:hypothetical protein [Candidatus Atribacteria bacterium]